MDKNYIYDEKLTPSAREALNDTMIELHEMLLSKANSVAQKGQTADKEISLRDILEAKDSLFKAKLDKEKADFRRKRMMTLISLTGALYSIIGIVVYVYQNRDFAIEKNLGLIIILTGIMTIFMGFVYSLLIARKNEEKQKEVDTDFRNSDNDFEVIKRWQIIEKLGSNLMRQRGYSNNESKSINDILKFLSMELQSDRLYMEMRELLSIRNRILHEGHDLSRNEKQFYLDKADKIIELLEKLEK
jgi:VIT1/CCC1 family predicted Fe2+/Mn2+ transporter